MELKIDSALMSIIRVFPYFGTYFQLFFFTLKCTKNVNYFFSILPLADDMVENENETLRDRVSDLEKRVHDQNDEITCLRATLADALRRINSLESTKGTLSQKRYLAK